MKKKRNLLRIAAISVIIGTAFTAFTGCSRNVKEKEDTYVNLADYYGVGSDGEYGIVVDGQPAGTAVTIGDRIYLPQEVVASKINSKFYLDIKNKQIRYASPTDIKIINVDGEDGNAVTHNGEVYLELEYVTDGSNVKQAVEKEPDRLVFFTEMKETDTYSVSGDTVIRQQPSGDSSVMTKINAGQLLYKAETIVAYGDTQETKEEPSEWLEVITEKGIRGYVKQDKVKESSAAVLVPNKEQPSYSHISLGKKVCLGWQLMTNKEGNSEIREKIKGAKGLNVISPTWYVVSDAKGNITSYASKDYVKTAHNNDLQVWALINDFATDESGASYVLQALADTDSRTNIINSLLAEAKEYGFDGINVDFEKISIDYGKDYVQFIRELSIECRNKGIVLSVDMYVPMSYNQYYNRAVVGQVADYLIIMGYDEHWAGCGQAGSVASISYVKNGINNTLKTVEPDRVINAVPFYTRIWTETPSDTDDGSGTYVEDNINGNYMLTSRAVGMNAAEKNLEDGGGEKIWQEDIGQYYGAYENGNAFVRIWLEEERSMETRLNAMDEAGLAGVACWQLGFEKPEIWDVIQAYLNK
ncbi:MAG: hypothetical protein K1W00_08565 [Lachnospiraceae bacterium]